MAERGYTKNEAYPGTKLKGRDRYKRLYHYTSFDTFVKIWLTKQLKFGVVENVNDIQEAEISCQISNLQQMPLMYAYNDIRREYKQISLAMDYDSYIKGCMSTMMWGHYADKRKGVCIELDYDKLIFPKGCLKGVVKYKTILPKYCQLDPAMKTMAQIRAFIKQKSNEIFFTKHMSWKGENEFRIVCNTSDYLDISEAISAVYLTSCDSLECELTEKLVADIIPVKYLRYTGTSKNLALPILCETKKSRLQNIKAKNNPDNALNTIQQQAREIYESKKNILRASLLQEVIHLKNKD